MTHQYDQIMEGAEDLSKNVTELIECVENMHGRLSALNELVDALKEDVVDRSGPSALHANLYMARVMWDRANNVVDKCAELSDEISAAGLSVFEAISELEDQLAKTEHTAGQS